MRIIWNVLLGLAAVTAALALLFQGFAFTAMSAELCLVLRIAGSVCCQCFFLRITRQKILQALPLMAASALAVWGFFLYLTSPSWLGATFGSFLSDYASYAISCCFVWLLSWLLPRLIFRIQKAIQRRTHIKKTATPPPQGYGKKKKGGKA